jgi:hypothetical protein
MRLVIMRSEEHRHGAADEAGSAQIYYELNVPTRVNELDAKR